jgi:lysyl-tRNA synthetase class 2
MKQIMNRHQALADELYDLLIKKSLPFDNIPESIRAQFNIALKEIAQGTGYIEHGLEDFEVTQSVFEKLIEPTLIQPTFVTHLPKELVPLAKLSPDDPTTVEVFECCINGQEIAPGYTEQNDPIAQRNTLEHQAGGEQQKLDEDFLVALEHGMPPAGGIGIGIDRLCMMLLGQESIRDVILFPQMKPK